MEKLGAPQTHLALKEMIREVDEDHDSKISFREVCLSLSPRSVRVFMPLFVAGKRQLQRKVDHGLTVQHRNCSHYFPIHLKKKFTHKEKPVEGPNYHNSEYDEYKFLQFVDQPTNG